MGIEELVHAFILFSFADLCPFGNIYDFVDDVSIGPLSHRFACNSLVRLHGATEVNVTFSSFQIETAKDVVWFYPGLTSDSSGTNYPGFDDSAPPATVTTYTVSNFWLEIYTDKNVVSQGFTLSISAGKKRYKIYLQPK